MGILDLKIGLFATERQLFRAVSGDPQVFKEAAPSAFRIKDIIFAFVVIVLLTFTTIFVRWILNVT